ncbi:hypothetical protein LJB90_02845 [Eubacteriales bacterium OttesenSCG-928-G02]|nr:hypothetical protein [Eubacteriales bacterium OttesenSCG-928-G02]
MSNSINTMLEKAIIPKEESIIKTSEAVFLGACIVVLLIFIGLMFMKSKKRTLMHRIFMVIAALMVVWVSIILSMRFIDPNNEALLKPLDAVTTTCAAFAAVLEMLFVISYLSQKSKRMSKKLYLALIVPALSALIVSTNDYHHLYYKVFSLDNKNIEFGPYFYIHSVYIFSCIVIALFLIMKYAIKSKNSLHVKQAILFAIGVSIPAIANLLTLFKVIEGSVITTPIAFTATIIFHGIAIFKYRFFDIKPIAMQQLINLISDCYLVVSPEGDINTFNQQFLNIIGNEYNIKENSNLNDFIRTEDVENKTTIYNLISGINSCQGTKSRITYEQTISRMENEEVIMSYYIVEITSLVSDNEVVGFLVMFKDVTQVKLNMQRAQDSQVKLMERERLAFLGQMVGGLAHNLKTPIMSISGSLSAVETLITECRESLDDPEVVNEDYKEIYGEMEEWISKMRSGCAYMSDIINAVKGQARNMNVSDGIEFTLDETFKRMMLLLRHEIQKSTCNVEILYTPSLENKDIVLHGDINNMIQIFNNLVSNSIDAQIEGGDHTIKIEVGNTDKDLIILFKDKGQGIPEAVKKDMFNQMITSKGNLGTGLGIFISNSVLHAKFDGKMWFDDNPGGGTIMGLSVPLNTVIIKERTEN